MGTETAKNHCVACINYEKRKGEKKIYISGTIKMISWQRKNESKKDQKNERRKEVRKWRRMWSITKLTVEDKESLYCLMESGIN